MKCVMQVTGFKIGCFIVLFHLPQYILATYLPIENVIPMSTYWFASTYSKLKLLHTLNINHWPWGP